MLHGVAVVSDSTKSAVPSVPHPASDDRRTALEHVSGRRFTLPACLRRVLKLLLGCGIPNSGRASADAASTVEDRSTESLAITCPADYAKLMNSQLIVRRA